MLRITTPRTFFRAFIVFSKHTEMVTREVTLLTAPGEKIKRALTDSSV